MLIKNNIAQKSRNTGIQSMTRLSAGVYKKSFRYFFFNIMMYNVCNINGTKEEIICL